MRQITRAGALACGIALAGAVASTPAFAGFSFDVNGDTAAGGGTFVDGFQWAPGNVLVDNVVPFSFNEYSFTLRAQGTLSGFSGSAATLDPFTEITYTLSVPVVGFVNLSGGVDNVIFDPNSPGGQFDLFYDNFGSTGGTPANDISGSGYNDGRQILSASFLPPASLFSGANLLIVTPASGGALDQFGADNRPGITTVQMVGSLSLDLEIGFFDATFFTGGGVAAPSGADFTFAASLSAPFDQVNPSQQVVGVTPDFGTNNINDFSCGTSPTACDLQVESLGASSTFEAQETPQSVPEPGTLALFAAGLIGLAFAGRRRWRA